MKKIPKKYSRLCKKMESNGHYPRLREMVEYGTGVIFATKKMPDGGLTGTSFTVVLKNETWFLLGWGYRFWRVPNNADIEEICAKWLAHEGNAMVPPEYVVDEFSLEELDFDQLKNEFIETLIPFILREIHKYQKEHFKRTHHFAESFSELLEFAEKAPWEWVPSNVTLNLLIIKDGWKATAVDANDNSRFEIDETGTVIREKPKT